MSGKRHQPMRPSRRDGTVAPVGDDGGRPDDGDFDRRLNEARRHAGRANPKQERDQSGLGVGLRFGVELVAAVAVGGAMGYFLDRWLGTWPWLFIVFFFLGAATGIRNIIRVAEEMDEERRKRDGDS